MGLLNQLRQTFTPNSQDTKTEEGSGSTQAGETRIGGKAVLSDSEKRKRLALLTQRETDTCLLLLEGYTLKETAKQLGVKYPTANTHMTELYKKLGVNTRPELIIKYKDISANKP